ncbi:hypothetical protein ACEPAF_4778 [Sanghuangporus sanghuang]
MITPRFSCSQTPNSVIIRIYTPAVRASDIEIHVDDTFFSLHINPYFLRLNFPSPVVEDDASSAVYDPASGYLTVTLTKAMPGSEFKDLDVLAKLLAPPKRDEPLSKSTIEVISSQDAELPEQSSGDGANVLEDLTPDQREVLEAAENDWHLPQNAPDAVDTPSISITTERRYGFLDAYTCYFRHVANTENEVNELGPDVEILSPVGRREKRLKHEEEKWDEGFYMADYVDDEHIRELVAYKPPPESPCSSELPDSLAFTEEENTDMLRLPRKEYLVTPLQKHNLYLTLLTILFSYAYEMRTTENDPTPESAWTICSLTPAFSALDPAPYGSTPSSPSTFTPGELQETLVPSFRRALAFPLYRSFVLAERCLQDVSIILRHGMRATLRALLETKRILERHEVYYIYSKVWVEDFCRWVASDASEGILRSLGEALAIIEVNKQGLGWDLAALETAALEQESREPDSDDDSEPDAAPQPILTSGQGDNREGNISEDDTQSTSSSSATASSLPSSSPESLGSGPDASPSLSSGSESESQSSVVSQTLAFSSRSSLSGP